MAYKKNSYKAGGNKSGGSRLHQHGGEGTESYMRTVSDMKLPQHGGEGKQVAKKTDMKLLSESADYCGLGRYL